MITETSGGDEGGLVFGITSSRGRVLQCGPLRAGGARHRTTATRAGPTPTIGRMADAAETVSPPAPLAAAVFDQTVAFDPADDFSAFVKTVPARWAVYLLAD